jgi:hypothetical protein
VASLSTVVEVAREHRRQNVRLRAELSRLTLEHTRVREVHVACRRSCDEALLQGAVKRGTLPSWPAWTGPTADLRLTLVPLES